MNTLTPAIVLLLSLAAHPATATTVLYQDRVITIEETLADPNDLWIRPSDLKRTNGFELKPEGACLEDLCVPVRQDADNDLWIRRQQKPWFNVTELARRLDQPYVFDPDNTIWSFGALPVQRTRFVKEGIALDFEIPDREGKPVRLSDFKGKKVLLLTWASW